MVTRASNFKRTSRRGSLTTEMVIGMAFLLVAIMPLAYSFAKEQRYLRNCYLRAVAMQAVDGEMEILAAGEWRAFKPGTQTYAPSTKPTNLPAGTFSLTIAEKHLRLEWRPEETGQGGKMVREVTLK